MLNSPHSCPGRTPWNIDQALGVCQSLVWLSSLAVYCNHLGIPENPSIGFYLMSALLESSGDIGGDITLLWGLNLGS